MNKSIIRVLGLELGQLTLANYLTKKSTVDQKSTIGQRCNLVCNLVIGFLI